MSKPFNLAAAIDGASLTTLEDHTVSAFAYSSDAIGAFPVRACVNGHWHAYTREGTLRGYGGEPSPLDLRIATVKREGWVNVYHNPKLLMGAELGSRIIYPSWEEARGMKAASGDLLSTTKIEWEE